LRGKRGELAACFLVAKNTPKIRALFFDENHFFLKTDTKAQWPQHSSLVYL
jgi:hypothetical protein